MKNKKTTKFFLLFSLVIHGKYNDIDKKSKREHTPSPLLNLLLIDLWMMMVGFQSINAGEICPAAVSL